MKIKNFTK